MLSFSKSFAIAMIALTAACGSAASNSHVASASPSGVAVTQISCTQSDNSPEIFVASISLSDSGAILNVHDQYGPFVQNAAAKVKQVDSGVTYSANSDADDKFSFPIPSSALAAPTASFPLKAVMAQTGGDEDENGDYILGMTCSSK